MARGNSPLKKKISNNNGIATAAKARRDDPEPASSWEYLRRCVRYFYSPELSTVGREPYLRRLSRP